MIKHIVMWRLKEENKAENAAEVKAQLEALPAKIEQILELEVGINIAPGDAAADVVLVSSFKCEECLAIYAAHPAHQEVVSFVKGVVSERRVVDYEL